MNPGHPSTRRDAFSRREMTARFALAQLAVIASFGGDEEAARNRAQLAEDVPSLRSDWTYALAWALFRTDVAS